MTRCCHNSGRTNQPTKYLLNRRSNSSFLTLSVPVSIASKQWQTNRLVVCFCWFFFSSCFLLISFHTFTFVLLSMVIFHFFFSFVPLEFVWKDYSFRCDLSEFVFRSFRQLYGKCYWFGFRKNKMKTFAFWVWFLIGCSFLKIVLVLLFGMQMWYISHNAMHIHFISDDELFNLTPINANNSQMSIE